MMQQDFNVFPSGSGVMISPRIGASDGNESTSSREWFENHAIGIQTVADRIRKTGGSILLASGDYTISQPVRLGSNTTLKGAGRATRLVVDTAKDEAEGADLTGGPAGVGIIIENARGSTIADLSVIPARPLQEDTGIIVESSGDCTLRDVYVSRFGRYGIWVRNNSFLCEVRGCKLAGNRRAGICLDHLERGSAVGDYVPNLITNCIAYGGEVGFECNRAIVANFVGCLVFQTETKGFHIHSVSNSVLLSGCRTFKISGDAVVVDESHEINISSNIFCWHRGTGISLHNVSWGSISTNNVIDSGSECTGGPKAVGIALSGASEGLQVTGNSVFNWGGQGRLTYGICESESCRNNGITNNNINLYENAGVDSQGNGSIAAMNIEVKEPAYKGSPDAPDPRFSLDSMNEFIDDQFGGRLTDRGETV